MDFIYVSDAHQLPKHYSNMLVRWWGSYRELKLDGGILFLRSSTCDRSFAQDEEVVVCLQGYIRCKNDRLPSPAACNLLYAHWIAQNRNSCEASNFSGCFSSFVYCRKTHTCFLTTEWGVSYPLYYKTGHSAFWVSSSIVLLGALCGSEPDEVGVAQLMNHRAGLMYGRRTFLKDLFQLKGDERLVYSANSGALQYFYNTNLYKNIDENEKLPHAAMRYWELVKQEYQSALIFDNEVHVAQSGGLDSRLMLAAIPDDKTIYCHTYGESEFYETKIARLCAKEKKAHWKNYPVDGYVLPSIDKINSSIRRCDEFEFGCWLSIFENIDARQQCFLLGDLFEAFSGRGIDAYYRRDRQIASFIDYYVLNREFSFTPFSNAQFQNWKSLRKQEIVRSFKTLDFSAFKLQKKDLVEETLSDFELNCNFISRQDIPFCELFDEAYNWSCLQDRQLVLGKNIVYPMAPGMSNKLLEAGTSIHPKLRVCYRLVDAIFRLPEVKKYARFPTAQVPFIPFSWPNLIKLPVWGGRSILDRLLVKRIMAQQNANLRYRVVNGVNFPKMYQKPDLFDTVNGWFYHDPYGFNALVVESFEKRRNFQKMPLLPMREFGLAALMSKLNALEDLKTLKSS